MPGGFSYAFSAHLVQNAYIFVFEIIYPAINLKCLDTPNITLKNPRLCELGGSNSFDGKEAKWNAFSRNSGHLSFHLLRATAQQSKDIGPHPFPLPQ